MEMEKEEEEEEKKKEEKKKKKKKEKEKKKKKKKKKKKEKNKNDNNKDKNKSKGTNKTNRERRLIFECKITITQCCSTFMYPIPPRIWMHSSATNHAASWEYNEQSIRYGLSNNCGSKNE